MRSGMPSARAGRRTGPRARSSIGSAQAASRVRAWRSSSSDRSTRPSPACSSRWIRTSRGLTAKWSSSTCPGLADRLVAGEVDPDACTSPERLCLLTREIGSEGTSARPVSGSPTNSLSQLGAHGNATREGARRPAGYRVGDRQGRHACRSASRGASRRSPRTARHTASMLWSNANVSENFPEPVSPLLYSIASVGYYHYFRNLGLAFGVSRRRLAAMDSGAPHDHRRPRRAHVLQPHQHPCRAPHGAVRRPSRGRVQSLRGRGPEGRQPAARRAGGTAAAEAAQALELVRIACAVAWQFLFLRRRLRTFERTADEFAARTTHERCAALARPARRRPGRIHRHPLSGAGRTPRSATRRQWSAMRSCDNASRVTASATPRTLDSFARCPDVPSSQPALRLWALSRAINADKALRTCSPTSPAPWCWRPIRTEHRVCRVSPGARRIPDDWGFRSSGELMLTTPTLEEQPEPVISLLQQYIEVNGESPEDHHRAAGGGAASRDVPHPAHARRSRTGPRRPHVAAAPEHPDRRGLPGARAAEAGAALHAMPPRRAAHRRSARPSGQLETPDDVFMLTWQEIEELCAGRAMFPHGVAALVETPPARSMPWRAA